MKSQSKHNDEKLLGKRIHHDSAVKMSKKRRQKIDKIMKDSTLTQKEKDVLIS